MNIKYLAKLHTIHHARCWIRHIRLFVSWSLHFCGKYRLWKKCFQVYWILPKRRILQVELRKSRGMDPQYGLREGNCIFQFAWNISTHAHYICVCVFSSIQLFVTPQTADLQAPLSMGFPRQEYWSGFPFPSLEDLPDPGINSASPALTGGFFTTEPPGKPIIYPHYSQ